VPCSPAVSCSRRAHGDSNTSFKALLGDCSQAFRPISDFPMDGATTAGGALKKYLGDGSSGSRPSSTKLTAQQDPRVGKTMEAPCYTRNSLWRSRAMTAMADDGGEEALEPLLATVDTRSFLRSSLFEHLNKEPLLAMGVEEHIPPQFTKLISFSK
jgi:hypothetical protein